MIVLINLKSLIKLITSQTELHVYGKHGSACTLEEALFVSLDNFAKISILLDKDNDLEEQITHLFDEVNIFILKFEKNETQSTGSKYTKNMYRNAG